MKKETAVKKSLLYASLAAVLFHPVACVGGGWYGTGNEFFSSPFVDTGPLEASGPSTFSSATGSGAGEGTLGGFGSGVGAGEGFADAIFLNGQSNGVVNSFGGGAAGSNAEASGQAQATGEQGSSAYGTGSATSQNAGSSNGF